MNDVRFEGHRVRGREAPTRGRTGVRPPACYRASGRRVAGRLVVDQLKDLAMRAKCAVVLSTLGSFLLLPMLLIFALGFVG